MKHNKLVIGLAAVITISIAFSWVLFFSPDEIGEDASVLSNKDRTSQAFHATIEPEELTLSTNINRVRVNQERGIVRSVGSLLNEADDVQAELASIETFELAFSTYIGGDDREQARDVYVDTQGYIYITGGTASPDFPTTMGPGYNNGPCSSLGGSGGMDVFVMKFDSSGDLAWSRLLGGPCYDRTYAIEVDNQGHIYIAGRAGEDFPTTPGVLQPDFQGTPHGPYGTQNAFVAELAPDGSLVWASYVGVGGLARDLALDSFGEIYLPLTYNGVGGVPPASWFVNAYQDTLQGGLDNGAVKIKKDGSQVLWATWLGGSADEIQNTSIRVDADKNVYLSIRTISDDIPTTPGAFDRTYNGGWDNYIAKLSPDGSSLVFGTYLGGSVDEGNSAHTLALDNLGNVYASPWTNSPDFPTTPGAFQTTFSGNPDITVVKLSSTGELLQSTFIGGTGIESVEGIYVDASGIVFTTGLTNSTNFPTTASTYQSNLAGGDDGLLIRLAADFSHLVYSSYMGGGSYDAVRSSFLGQDGNLYVVGETSGSDWPTINAYQSTYAGGLTDAFLAKFTPTSVTPPVSTIFIPIVFE